MNYREDSSIQASSVRHAAMLLTGLLVAVIIGCTIKLIAHGIVHRQIHEDALNIVELIFFLEMPLAILQLITVIWFFVWIYRASRGARELGAIGMGFSPLGAVGWYFVPVANLWIPYLAMREIWRASKNPGGWMKESTARSVLPVWWFWVLCSSFLGQKSFIAFLRAWVTTKTDAISVETIVLLRAANIYEIFFLAACIIASIATLELIREIQQFQSRSWLERSR